jgi:hypothetical protein
MNSSARQDDHGAWKLILSYQQGPEKRFGRELGDSLEELTGQ